MSPGRLLPLVLSAVLAAAVVLCAVTVPFVVGALRGADGSPAGDGPIDLSEVVVAEDLDPSHTDEDVDYAHVPPLGGEHAPVWWECGSYDQPIADELAVHSLEHGTVWITYRLGLSSAELEALRSRLPAEGILSPYPDLPAPVVVSVWGRQLALDGADDPRLPLFLERFGDGGTAPEPLADCAGGVSDLDDVPGEDPGAGTRTVRASLS